VVGEGKYRVLDGNSADAKHATCLLLTADVVVVTGSTFPSAVLAFAPQGRPILLEEQRHNQNINEEAQQWFSPSDVAVHLLNGAFKHSANATSLQQRLAGLSPQ
jgi:hypothetical protein